VALWFGEGWQPGDTGGNRAGQSSLTLNKPA
jgi:hypothetical protein